MPHEDSGGGHRQQKARILPLRRFTATIAGKSVLGIVVPLVLVFGGFLTYSLVVQRQQAHEEVEHSQIEHAEMLRRMLRDSMLRAPSSTAVRHDLAGIVAAIREAERYSEVLITDPRGVVRFSSDPAMLGTVLEPSRPECKPCHAGAEVKQLFEPQATLVEVRSPEGGTVLRTAGPLRNEKPCQRCHGADGILNGHVTLEVPLGALEAKLSRVLWAKALTIVVLFLAAIGAVYFFQHRLVVRPLSALTTRARAVERGDLSAFGEDAVEVDDEVGELAAAFRRMVGRLADAQAELEDKVQARTAELHEVSRQLQLLNTKLMQVERLTTMGELAATIAHEVRTPLNALSINLQLLKRELKAHRGCEAASRDTVAILEGEITRINTVVEEFLRYARLPRPKLEPVDLNELCRGVLQLLELEAQRSGIIVSFEPHGGAVRVRADQDQLRQVVINLVLNGIQAMKEGGRLTVRTEHSDTDVTLVVADTGPGIAQDLEMIFKPFFTTKEKGTGLGLAIASRIVGEHGGQLEASSTAGEGAAFTVRLPTGAGRDETDSDDGD